MSLIRKNATRTFREFVLGLPTMGTLVDGLGDIASYSDFPKVIRSWDQLRLFLTPVMCDREGVEIARVLWRFYETAGYTIPGDPANAWMNEKEPSK
ncbi:MAG: hypothetical protein ACLP4V_35040 [Methylocella sp.]